jgi:hypothetical protein
VQEVNAETDEDRGYVTQPVKCLEQYPRLQTGLENGGQSG